MSDEAKLPELIVPSDEPKYNARGFRVYTKFTDTYRMGVDVTQSSLATEDRVWLHVGSHGSAHLNLQQAIWVRDALAEWVVWALVREDGQADDG